MPARLLALGCFLTLTPARAADDHPFKATKVGDSVTYAAAIKAGGGTREGTVTQTVTAKTDAEATVEVTARWGGADVPTQTQKIDLTKPYNPATAYIPPGAEIKTEKLKDGTEKLTVGGKEYAATWTTSQMTGNVPGVGVRLDAEVKTWTAKGVPFGVLKMEMTMAAADQKVEVTLELSEAKKKAKD